MLKTCDASTSQFQHTIPHVMLTSLVGFPAYQKLVVLTRRMENNSPPMDRKNRITSCLRDYRSIKVSLTLGTYSGIVYSQACKPLICIEQNQPQLQARNVLQALKGKKVALLEW